MRFRESWPRRILASIINREPDANALPANLHPRVRELLERCFEKEPKKRWQAAGDMVTGGPVPITEGVQRAIRSQNTTASANYAFSASGSGALVYVAGTDTGSNQRILALVDHDGAIAPLNAQPAPYRSPRVSPDVRKLAVETTGDDGVGVVWVYDLSGDEAIQQLTFEGDNRRPIWTPDSRYVTFASDRGGTMSLYWKPANGSGVAERLTTADEGTSIGRAPGLPTGGHFPSWSYAAAMIGIYGPLCARGKTRPKAFMMRRGGCIKSGSETEDSTSSS